MVGSGPEAIGEGRGLAGDSQKAAGGVKWKDPESVIFVPNFRCDIHFRHSNAHQ